MSTSSFLDKIFVAFPTPKFLDFPFAGIHITDQFVRAIEFEKGARQHKIKKYKEVPLPPDTINSGDILNKEELVKVLSTLKAEMGLEYVKVSLPEEKAYLFTTKLPIVKGADIKSAVESKIEENVPVSPSELIYDYKVFLNNQKEQLDIVVSNFPTSIVSTYTECILSAGLKPLVLEIESQAIVRALTSAESPNTCLIINFFKDKVGLYIETSGTVRFTSTVALKGELGNNPSFLLQEVSKLYIYWHTLKENAGNPEKKIEQIIICGEGFDESIAAYLFSHMSTPVVYGNVWLNAFDINKSVPNIDFNESLKFAGAV